MKKVFAVVLISGILGGNAYADDDSVCPDNVVARINNTSTVKDVIERDENGNPIKYGSGYGEITIGDQTYSSSDLTSCIKKRNNKHIVVAWNSSIHNGKIFKDPNTLGQKVGQQVVNARNIYKDYENNYGMSYGDDYSITIVAYGSGLDWLKTSTDPKNIEEVQGLLAKGAKIYACQNTMKSKKLVISDLIPGVQMVTSGVTALVDAQLQGLVYLNP